MQREKVLMRSLLTNLAVMHHDDIISALNGRQAMSHNYRSAVSHHPGYRLLNQLFRLSIN